MNKNSLSLFLFMILLGFSIAGYCSDSTDVFKVHIRSEISSVPDGVSKTHNSNEILRDIAEDAVKSLRSVRLNLAYSIRIKPEIISGGSCLLNTVFYPPVITGDNHFRGFEITDVLQPDKADLRLLFFDRTDNSQFRETNAQNLPVNWNDTLAVRIDPPCPDPQKDSVVVASLFLYYDEDALNRFHHRTDMIRDYYASCAILDSLKLMMDAMNILEVSHYPEYFVYINEINRAVQIIGEKQLQENLDLSGYDPKDFRKKYMEIFKRSRSITMTFEEQLEKADSIHTLLPQDSVISLFLSGMKRYIGWTMLVNDRNGNVYRDYLDRYFSMNSFGDDLSVLKKLLLKISPGMNGDSLLKQVLHNVVLAYGNEIRHLMNESRYAEATELLGNARQFGQYDPFPEKERIEDTSEDLAASGIFNSYLSVAESSVKYGKFGMAENYLAKALAYRKANSSLKMNDSLYRKVFLELISGQLAECDSLHANGKYLESLDCLNYVIETHDSISVASILPDIKEKEKHIYSAIVNEFLTNAVRIKKTGDPDSALFLFDMAAAYFGKLDPAGGMRAFADSVEPAFEQIRYDKLMMSADYLSRHRNFEAAFNAMEKAAFLRKQFRLPEDPSFDSLWIVIYPRHVEHQLMKAEKFIWTNDLEIAAKYADSISLLRSPELVNDTGLVSAIQKYRRHIHEKKCVNAKESIEVYEVRATYRTGKKMFMIAKTLLDSALLVAEKNPDCTIPVKSIHDTIDYYREAVTFQNAMAEAENLISAGLYKEAVQKYLHAESFFADHSVGRFGITCAPFYDFLREKSRLTLTYSAAGWYMQTENYQQVLSCLKLYRLQDGKETATKEMQHQLGKSLSLLDFAADPGSDPNVLVKNYSGDDDWFRSLEHSYVYQWNVLKHQSGKDTEGQK
jgi:tetratricopeptide (TPR) repeat protein